MDGAIKLALNSSNHLPQHLLGVLTLLTKLENRPWILTEMAYALCALVWENRDRYHFWGDFILFSLRVAFRNYDPLDGWHKGDLIHTQSHRELAVKVFESGNSEPISDLLCTLIMRLKQRPLVHSLDICKYIVGLPNRIAMPFSPRLRRLLLRVIECIGVNGFKEVGVENFVWLVDRLGTEAQERDLPDGWGSILLDVVQTPGAHRHLALPSWELLTELASKPRLWNPPPYASEVTVSLLDDQEWDKLECWLVVVPVLWHWWIDDRAEEVLRLRHALKSLIFQQQHDAFRQLKQRMEQRIHKCGVPGALKTFKRICKVKPEAKA